MTVGEAQTTKCCATKKEWKNGDTGKNLRGRRYRTKKKQKENL